MVTSFVGVKSHHSGLLLSRGSVSCQTTLWVVVGRCSTKSSGPGREDLRGSRRPETSRGTWYRSTVSYSSGLYTRGHTSSLFTCVTTCVPYESLVRIFAPSESLSPICRSLLTTGAGGEVTLTVEGREWQGVRLLVVSVFSLILKSTKVLASQETQKVRSQREVLICVFTPPYFLSPCTWKRLSGPEAGLYSFHDYGLHRHWTRSITKCTRTRTHESVPSWSDSEWDRGWCGTNNSVFWKYFNSVRIAPSRLMSMFGGLLTTVILSVNSFPLMERRTVS